VRNLPAAPSVKPAATVEFSATAESLSAVESSATAFRGETVEPASTANRIAPTVPAVISEPATAIKARPASVERRPATVKSSAAIVTMEPRSGAYKGAPDKIVRSIETIRGARVRSIVVIAIGANGSRTDIRRPGVNWPESNSNPDLRVGRTRHHHAKPK
jgi:hypothetical protein